MPGLENRARIADYIAGALSAPEAEDGLEDAVWPDDDGALEQSERRLANDALRLFAEHSAGDLDRIGAQGEAQCAHANLLVRASAEGGLGRIGLRRHG